MALPGDGQVDLGFDRTYEGLKPSRFILFDHPRLVLTVPMRV